MKLLERILVPIDINVDSKEQLNTAIEMAQSYNSEIIIMSVITDEVLPDSVKGIVKNAVSDHLNEAKENLEKTESLQEIL